MANKYLSEFLTRLRAITAPCRIDMHEPDEQGVKVRFVGDHLDNAMGEDVSVEAIERGYQEYVVIIERFDGKEFHRDRFNLATLIACARLTKEPV